MIAAHAAGIRVFATGGIGGVHRGAFGPAATLDVSSDLEELARTPLAVVCAGPKAILDLPLTLEYLETRGVPVVAVGQSEVPGFYSTSSGVAAPHVVPGVAEAAWLVATHLGLGLGSGILLCIPVPAAVALPFDDARVAIEQALVEADAVGGRRARADALAPGPGGRADGWRVRSGEHGPDRKQRPDGRAPGGGPGRLLTRGRPASAGARGE